MQIDGEAWTAFGAVVTGLVGGLVALWRRTLVERTEHEAEKKVMRDDFEKEKAQLRTERDAEKTARIDDAKGYTAMALKLQETVINAINDARLSDVKVATEISENTKATRELTGMLAGEQPERPRPQPRRPMGSRP